MHMVATNLCEWLYTLVEETKHEIWHLSHSAHSPSHDRYTHEAITNSENIVHNETLTAAAYNQTHVDVDHNILKRSVVGASQMYEDCQRTNIMGSLVSNSIEAYYLSPLLVMIYYSIIRFKTRRLFFSLAPLSIL